DLTSTTSTPTETGSAASSYAWARSSGSARRAVSHSKDVTFEDIEEARVVPLAHVMHVPKTRTADGVGIGVGPEPGVTRRIKGRRIEVAQEGDRTAFYDAAIAFDARRVSDSSPEKRHCTDVVTHRDLKRVLGSSSLATG